MSPSSRDGIMAWSDPRRFLLAVAVGLASACGPEAPPMPVGERVAVRDSAGVRIVESAAPVWGEAWVIEDRPLLRIGQDPAEPGHDLWRVSAALLLGDGRVVIANAGTSELRWVSGAGELLGVVGGPGAGPGEFGPFSLAFPALDDSIAVFDLLQRRLSVLDANGTLARTFRIEGAPTGPGPIGRLPDGSWLLATGQVVIPADRGPIRIERTPIDVYRLSEDSPSGAPVHLATLPGEEVVVGPTGATRQDGSVVIGRIPRRFGLSSVVAVAPDGWIVGDNARAELVRRDSAGRVVEIVRWEVPVRKVTSADVQADHQERLRGRDDPEERRAREAAWRQHPGPPSAMPVFEVPLLVDAGGHTWVKVYAPPAERGGARFFVFDPEGLWLGEVAAPQGLRILAVGRDRVAGLSRDEWGVDVVSVHAIRRP